MVAFLPPPTAVDGTSLSEAAGVVSVKAGYVSVPLIAGMSTNPGSGSTQYLGISGTLQGFGAAEAQVEAAFPFACKIKNLRAMNRAATAASSSITIALRKEAATQALTVTVGAGVAARTVTPDLVNVVTVAAGDRLAWECVSGVTPPGTTFTITAEVEML